MKCNNNTESLLNLPTMEKVLIFASILTVAVNAALVQQYEMLDLKPASVTKKNYGFIPMIKDEDFGVK